MLPLTLAHLMTCPSQRNIPNSRAPRGLYSDGYTVPASSGATNGIRAHARWTEQPSAVAIVRTGDVRVIPGWYSSQTSTEVGYPREPARNESHCCAQAATVIDRGTSGLVKLGVFNPAGASVADCATTLASPVPNAASPAKRQKQRRTFLQ